MRASDFEGLWRGNNGAEVHLLQSGDAISGTYTAKAADPTIPCRGRILVGTADGAVIGFVTSCPAPHLIMSWIGHLVGSDGSTVQELHASCQTVNRMPRNMSMAQALTQDIVIFTKISGRPKNKYSNIF